MVIQKVLNILKNLHTREARRGGGRSTLQGNVQRRTALKVRVGFQSLSSAKMLRQTLPLGYTLG